MSRPKKTVAPSSRPTAKPSIKLAAALGDYQKSNKLTGKGQIATMIFAARLVTNKGLPFDVVKGITTEGEGQVKGLSKSAVQTILKDHGIDRVLAEEGGRTSRGSLGNIRNFIAFLNELHLLGLADMPAVEAWWVAQAMQFFNAKPFALKFEPGRSLRSVIRNLLAQAKARQVESNGTKVVGAMLQHLIGAKLELALPRESIKHHGFSVADGPSRRSGDFEIGQSCLHVTTAPGEAVARKCADNLSAGLHPVIITIHEMLPAADIFTAHLNISEQVDVLDAEQFIVGNLHELGGFQSAQRRVTVEALIERYNAIVESTETDLSLQISAK
jgi:hypothetical protein